MRTIFNILGPMTNPAGVTRMLIGVFSNDLCRPVAEVLGKLGAEHVLVVHSDDGLDEISIASPTRCAEFRAGELREFQITPANLGIGAGDLEGLEVPDAAASLQLIQAALTGDTGERARKAANMIAVNAGAALYVAGLSDDIEAGVDRALDVIRGGEAWEKLQQLAAMTSGFK